MLAKTHLTCDRLVKFLCLGFLTLAIAFTFQVNSARADAIYHAFDECLVDVTAELADIQAAGYTHVQVSPINATPSRKDDACTSDEEWYIQYQPFDYVIDGNLGNETDFVNLVEAAHDRDLKVIVDVVFNHMANYRYYQDVAPFPEAYPLYPKTEYFHPVDCINDYNNTYEVENEWLCSNNDPEGLPDLRTDLPYVQQQEQAYMQKLLALGADGFRFDAVKHMSPEDITGILSGIPEGIFSYGEVIGNTREDSERYIPPFSKITDFQLVNTLKSAFSVGGDLRALIDPANTNRALPGYEAITFAQNHDTWAPRQFDNWKFDPVDLSLATAYVLAIKEGTPLILRFDAFTPTAIAAGQFRAQMDGESQYYRNGNEIAAGADSPNLLFIERGNKGLAMINKAGGKFDVPVAKMPGLSEGCYRELLYDFEMCVGVGGDGQKYIEQWGSPDRGGIDIGGRTALFFVKR